MQWVCEDCQEKLKNLKELHKEWRPVSVSACTDALKITVAVLL